MNATLKKVACHYNQTNMKTTENRKMNIVRPVAIIVLFLITGGKQLSAQDYRTAIGIRTGVTSGFTYKSIYDRNKAVEALMTFRHDGFQLTGMAMQYTPAFENKTDRAFWYVGAGGHVGYHRWSNNSFLLPVDTSSSGAIIYDRVYDKPNRTSPALGFDFVMGLEYQLETMPLLIGVEYKPYIGIFGPSRVARSFVDFAFTARYVLNY